MSLLALAAYWFLGDYLTLEWLAQQEARMREYQLERPILVLVFAFLLYVTVAGLSIPGGATVLTLVMAWYFGFLQGVFLVSFASTLGATLAFLFARYVFRRPFHNLFPGLAQKFNDNLERDGPFYLFTLRLIPAVPFFLVNVVMGLTPIRTTTFWWISQLGMFPATCVYVYAGASVPSLSTLSEQGMQSILSTQLVVAFTLLGLSPLAIKKLTILLKKKT